MEEIENNNDNYLKTEEINIREKKNDMKMNNPTKNVSNTNKILTNDNKSKILQNNPDDSQNKHELSHLKRGKIDIFKGKFFNLPPISQNGSRSNSPGDSNILSTISFIKTSYLNKYRTSIHYPKNANSSDKNKKHIDQLKIVLSKYATTP